MLNIISLLIAAILPILLISFFAYRKRKIYTFYGNANDEAYLKSKKRFKKAALFGTTTILSLAIISYALFYKQINRAIIDYSNNPNTRFSVEEFVRVIETDDLNYVTKKKINPDLTELRRYTIANDGWDGLEIFYYSTRKEHEDKKFDEVVFIDYTSKSITYVISDVKKYAKLMKTIAQMADTTLSVNERLKQFSSSSHYILNNCLFVDIDYSYNVNSHRIFISRYKAP